MGTTGTTIDRTITSTNDDPYRDPALVAETVAALQQVHGRRPTVSWPYETVGEWLAGCSRWDAALQEAMRTLDRILGAGDPEDRDWLDLLDRGDGGPDTTLAPDLPVWVAPDDVAGRDLVLARRRLALAAYWCDQAIAHHRSDDPNTREYVPTLADQARNAALRAGINAHRAHDAAL